MSVYKSIFKNYLANGVGMGINFLSQIALVPMFIAFWGVSQYADWILITSFTLFFNLTDVGLNTVSNNEFVMRYHRKEYGMCVKLQVNMFVFIAVVGLALTALAAAVAWIWGYNDMLGITVFTRTETSVVFVLLIAKIFIKMYGAVYHGIFNALSRAHILIMLNNVALLGELAILFLGLWFKMEIIPLAVVYCLPVTFSAIYKHIDSQRRFRVEFSFRQFDPVLLRSIIRPSLESMAMPIGYALQNQGMIFVVNSLLGPVVLLSFTTMRTAVNFLRSITNMVTYSASPEISVAYGRGDLHTLKQVYHRAIVITMALVTALFVLLAIFGKPVYLAWTHNEVAFDPVFFYGMLVLLLISCSWICGATILGSTNQYRRYSVFFMLSIAAGVVLSYAALRFYPHLGVLPFVLIPVEVVLSWFILHRTNKFLEADFNELSRGLAAEGKFLSAKAWGITDVLKWW